ncbi:GNAT family N-acetyltransferase [Megalodesulfovibrio gigas]|uniref:Putative N-acetyltransferase GCN5 n=1 Tax=Megalodesulfovibrio gigas (strain ATCC 19364 / DSM 1382 / NCIMB 9332 / VKM B-1759) TaxID=1121448 RepID=T2GAA5_MEGG1|nr:GNAT family N-acetyltransferase [Megalodesulfovibrio gigas]AGW12852.1 putative N-acetyltransferase GCN5 [Megalodesulfovibrio gigas DSM 1382 = ATCC 19364]
MDTLVIRTMTRAEVDFAVDMAAHEGWNPGLYDAECFHAADPDGFFIALVDDAPVGCVSAVQYGGVFGFLGFYVLLPAHRGKGYGLQLCTVAIDRLKRLQVPIIAADGVLAMLPKYEAYGFTRAYGNIRHEGPAGGTAPGDPRLRPLREVDPQALLALDAAHFGAWREAFLRCWTNPAHGEGLAWVEDGRLTGYGVVRPCVRGWKIGPLFAPHPEAAEALYLGLRALACGGPVYLDTPVPNAAALALAARHGMRPVFETARIHLGPPQILPLERIYGVTSFELG